MTGNNGTWRRDLAVALLDGRADTDEAVRVVARVVRATREEAGSDVAAAAGSPDRLGRPRDVALTLRLLGACAAIEAPECMGYRRPIAWPLLEEALAAVRDVEAALTEDLARRRSED